MEILGERHNSREERSTRVAKRVAIGKGAHGRATRAAVHLTAGAAMDQRDTTDRTRMVRSSSGPGYTAPLRLTQVPLRVRTVAVAVTCALMPLTACGGAATGGSQAGSATATATTSLSATDTVAVVAWFKDSRHHTGLESLDGGLSRYTAGSAASDASIILSACDELAHDIRILKTFEPIPDAPAQASWVSALAHLEQGSADCASGIINNDAAQSAKAKSEISKGDSEYAAVVDRLGTILGVHPTSSPT